MQLFINKLKENFLAESRRFALWLPVLFGVGIGLYFLLLTEPSYWFTIVFVEVLLILLYVFRFYPLRFMVTGALLVVLLGFSNIQIRSMYQSNFVEYPTSQNEVTYLKGQITKIDSNTKGKVRLLLNNVQDYENKRKGLYRVVLTDKSTKLSEGNCVEMVATVMPPMAPVVPNGYQFNRKSFFDGISAIGYANSFAYETDCEHDLSFSQKLSLLVNGLRKKVVQKINKTLSTDEASVVAAILAGEKGEITPKLYDNYRDSGLAHFLSISGLHMSMIAAMTFFAIRLLLSLFPAIALKYDCKKISAVFAICMSFFYLLISGADIPAQRAFIMTTVVLLGVIFSRNAISIRTLGFAAVIVLLISPQSLVSASFQMSFAAVLVLISFYERFAPTINKFFKGKNVVKIVFAYIIGLLISDLVASIATLPFAIYHFNKIAIYTTFGNLLAAPIIGLIIMPFVLLSLFLMPLNLYAWPLKIVGFGVNIVNNITSYVSSLPNAGYQVLSMPFWGLLLIVFGGLWLCIWQRKWRLWGIFPIIIGFLSIFCVSKPDVIYDSKGTHIALKDNSENLVIMPTRSSQFLNKMWQEKTASKSLDADKQKLLKKIYKGKAADKNWIDLSCTEDSCTYKNKFFWEKGGNITVNDRIRDTYEDMGAAVYIKDDKVKVKTIRSAIGKRLWN